MEASDLNNYETRDALNLDAYYTLAEDEDWKFKRPHKNQANMNSHTSELYERRRAQFGDSPENPGQLLLIEDEIKSRIKTTKEEIYHIGRLLTDGKRIVEHSKFQDWIESKFDFSYPMAALLHGPQYRKSG